MLENYEMIIGLEVHCELATKTKIFCACPTKFGAQPNTQVCPVCLGLPGALPVLNEEVVKSAVKAGVATNCKIARFSKQDRKNYFYPDLPKAYQISQYDMPLCYDGHLVIETEKGATKIGETLIHIEEDAGKLIHDKEKAALLDFNRCGVPLIEVVSKPDIRSSEEAVAYLKKLRAILQYCGLSDCKMNEGSFRCDVNLSVRKMGEQNLGVRTELKNLNSFQFISKAIEHEFKRQVADIENGEIIVQETRGYDKKCGKTFSMRKKEDIKDYRYFQDPELVPIIVSDEFIEGIEKEIPVLPDERKKSCISKYAITAYEAELITSNKEIADYFEEAVKFTSKTKILANLIIGEVFKMIDREDDKVKIESFVLGEIAQLSGEGYINSSVCKKLVAAFWGESVKSSVKKYVDENDLAQVSDKELLTKYTIDVFKNMPKLVEDFKNGKSNAKKAIIGQVMAKTNGNGNPIVINDIVTKMLELQ